MSPSSLPQKQLSHAPHHAQGTLSWKRHSTVLPDYNNIQKNAEVLENTEENTH